MNAKTKKTATEEAVEANPAATPMAEPEGGWPADEFTGIGGTYIRDPITGRRSRVEPATETNETNPSI